MISHEGRVAKEGAESEARPFPDLRYDRVCRTERSEAYLLSEGESPLGRVDLHFGGSDPSAHGGNGGANDCRNKRTRRAARPGDDGASCRNGHCCAAHRGVDLEPEQNPASIP